MGKNSSKHSKICKNSRQTSLTRKKKLCDFLNAYSKRSNRFDLFICRSALSIQVYEIIGQQYPKKSQLYTDRAPTGLRSLRLESNPLQLPCVVSTDPQPTFLRTCILCNNQNDPQQEAICDSIQEPRWLCRYIPWRQTVPNISL